MTEALARIEERYPVLAEDPAEIQQAIEANLGGERIQASDLDRIRVPSGRSTSWQIEGGLGESEEKVIEGVVIYTKLTRAYWSQTIEASGGSEPPDCISDDAVTGVGNPGGPCAKCQHAQFGSAPDGDGQACKQTRLLFILLPEDHLPSVVVAPPSALANLKRYLLALAKKKRPIWSAVTRLELERDKSKSGIDFARVKPSLATFLEAEEAQRMQSYAELMRPYLESLRVDVPEEDEDVEELGPEDDDIRF